MFALLLSIWSGIFQAGPSVSAPEPFLIIHTIQIEGNKKTKPDMILRELDIAPGDTLPGTQIDAALKRNRNKIFNTNLFNSVDLLLQPDASGRIVLMIVVAERWYIFPMVILELGDRNFNEWWNERGRDLRRLNYGGRVEHKNVFGNGEELRATVQFGFTRRFDLGYTIRYLDKARKSGLGFVASYATNNNVAFRTENNKLAFLNTSDLMRERFAFGTRFTRRPKFYASHGLEARLHYNTVADTVARLNPRYFLEGRTTQRFLQLDYDFTNDRRDVAAYPLRGHYFGVEVSRMGLLPADDANRTALGLNYALFRPLGKRFFWNMDWRGLTSYPARQPYSLYRGVLGFGSVYLRGYERYIIDGQHFGLARFTLKREMVATELYAPRLIPLKQFATIPLSVYLTAFTDFGYVHDPTRDPGNALLANKLLYSTGLGVDMVTFYNVVVRLNFAVNRTGDRGFFLNFAKDI